MISSQTSPFRVSVYLVPFVAGLLIASLPVQRLEAITRELPPSPDVFEGPFWLALVSPAYWLAQLPVIFCIAALWPAARVFQELESHKTFSVAVSRALERMGLCLCLSAVTAMFVVPYGVAWLSGVPAETEIGTYMLPLVLLIIGMVMSAIGRAGARLQADVDGFV